MKKIIVLIVGLLVFAGCASEEEKAEQKDLNQLETMGFSETDAQNFYIFSNSIKIVFSQMSDINTEMRSNNFVVPHEKFMQVSAAIEVSKDAYSKLNPKEKEEYNEYLANDKNKSRSPLLILTNIEKNKREFTVVEATLMYDNMNYFASKAIKSSEIPEGNELDAIKWFNENNAYSDLYKEAHDFRTNNQTKFD